MKKNRKFLLPLTALVGIFITGNVFASAKKEPVVIEAKVNQEAMNTLTTDVFTDNDPFKFILEKNNSGKNVNNNIVADHYSHGSHGSHSSHSSGQ